MTAEAMPATIFDDRTAEIGALYQEHVRLLVTTAMARYGIAEADAQGLAHDVFVAYLLKADQILDSRAWLLSAICNASKYFLRRRARHIALSPAIADGPDSSLENAGDVLTDQLAARQAVCCLTARCQLALRLRYFEGYTVPEMAVELGTTSRYATNLVARCLRQAHDRYTKGTS